MVSKKRNLAIKIGLILLAAMVFFTFFSSTIINFLTPKVTITTARQGVLNREVTFYNPDLLYKNTTEVKLPDTAELWLTVTDVYAEKGDTVSAEDTIISFDVSPLTEALHMQAAEFAEKEEALRRFDIRLEEERLRLERQIEDDEATLARIGSSVIISSGGGLVAQIHARNGDIVQAGANLADVADTSRMRFTVPFLSGDTADIQKGMPAEVSIGRLQETLPGVVERVYTGQRVDTYGSIVTDVEISLSNPGALREGDMAVVVVGSQYSCTETGALTYAEGFSIKAGSSGELAGFELRAGDGIAAGQIAGRILNETSDMQATRILEDIERHRADLAFMMDNETVNGQSRQSVTNAIDKAQKQYNALLAITDECREVNAGVNGFLQNVLPDAGQKLTGGDLLFIIFTDETKPSLRQSMTREEAAVLKTGDHAEIAYTVKDVDAMRIKSFTANAVIESITMSDDPFRPYDISLAFVQDIPFDVAISQVIIPLPAQSGIVVPLSAVIDGLSIYIVTENDTFLGKELRIERRNVMLGERDHSHVIVTEGLEGNEHIVSSWDRPIRDGQRVMLPND